MRRSRVPVAEKRSTESKTKYNSSLRKTTSMGPKITKKNFSFSMVNTRSNTENKTKEGMEGRREEPAIEIELETPDQSVDVVEKKTTESTPMPKAEEPNPNGVLTDRQSGRHNRHHARNGEGRVSSKKNAFY